MVSLNEVRVNCILSETLCKWPEALDPLLVLVRLIQEICIRFIQAKAAS